MMCVVRGLLGSKVLMADSDQITTLTAALHRLQEVVSQLQYDLEHVREVNMRKEGQIELLERQLMEKEKRLEMMYFKLANYRIIQKTITAQINGLQAELTRLQAILDDDVH